MPENQIAYIGLTACLDPISRRSLTLQYWSVRLRISDGGGDDGGTKGKLSGAEVDNAQHFARVGQKCWVYFGGAPYDRQNGDAWRRGTIIRDGPGVYYDTEAKNKDVFFKWAPMTFEERQELVQVKFDCSTPGRVCGHCGFGETVTDTTPVVDV